MLELVKAVAGKRIFTAISVVAGATLMLQILITRIFSVTMYYHYAFAVIAMTMLGLTVGALWIYIRREKTLMHPTAEANLAHYASGMAAMTLVAVLVHTQIPFGNSTEALLLGMIMFMPGFIYGGVVVSLILTHYAGQISRLYAADLIGAAIGCLLTIVLLEQVGVFNAVFLVCSAVALVACSLLEKGDSRRLALRVKAIAAAIGLLTIGNLSAQMLGLPHISLRWVKAGAVEEGLEFETWNSYSRVAIYDKGEHKPFGWGLSQMHVGEYPEFKVKRVDIDANAATFMTHFDDLSDLQFLTHDITNAAYHLRPVKSTAVIGVGGGRDVLSALVHGADHVLGMEMNKAILTAMKGPYAEFSGNLAGRPGVELVNDEARSYLVRQDRTFDLIQVSLIDTWAATATGAYALTENTLYTRQAWQNFFHLLNADGMLTFSRWHKPGGHEWEMLRSIKLAAETLEAEHVENIRDHIVIVRGAEVASIMVGKSAFTQAQVRALEDWATPLGFKVMLSPFGHDPRTIDDFKSVGELDAFLTSKGMSTVTPTDNQPYFFNILSLSQALRGMLGLEEDRDFNVEATYTLMHLLGTFLLLSLAFVIIPLMQTAKQMPLRGTLPNLGYFACLGLGFMFVEISQVQRMMIFLGHPTYALSVVLFTLLMFSGIGSLSTERVAAGSGIRRLVGLIAVLAGFALVTELAYEFFRGSATWMRLLVAFASIAPLGFVLGTAFPLGIKLAEAQGFHALLPWFWGINGVTSVLASILALVVAMFAGLHAAFAVGVACYVAAALLYRIQSGRASRA